MNEKKIDDVSEIIGLSELNFLEILSLDKNNLKSLPESIGNFKSLQVLKLKSNQLTTLPESIGNINSLQALVIKNNPLSTLPESIKILEQRGVEIYR